MKKALKIIGEVLKWILLVFIGLFAFRQIWNAVDTKNGSHHPLFGKKETTIVTASMSVVIDENKEDLKGVTNQIQVNDVIVTTNRVSYDDIKIHDIVLFRSKKGDICHRVILKYKTSDGKEMLVTRGDANNVNDDAIEFKDVIGKVIKILPQAGKFYSFLGSPYFLLGGSLALGFVVTGFLIAEIGKDKHKKAAEKAVVYDANAENLVETKTDKKAEEKAVISENSLEKTIENKVSEEKPVVSKNIQENPAKTKKVPNKKAVAPKEETLKNEVPKKDSKGRFVSSKPKVEESKKEIPLKDSKGRFVSKK